MDTYILDEVETFDAGSFEEQLQRTKSDYIEAKVKYLEQFYHVARIRRNLKNAKLAALADGILKGRNEDAREAEARDMFPEQYKLLAKTEDICNELHLRYVALEIQWDYLKMLSHA